MLYPITWSTTTYGLDGPWGAVSVQVGGYDNQPDPSDQPTVDLLPGGAWDTYILSPSSCGSNATADCAKGGTWDPETANDGTLRNQTGDGQQIYFQPSSEYNDGSGRWFGESTVYAQKLKFNGQGFNSIPSLTVPNSSICSVTQAWQRWPNGRVTSAQLGTLALGADGQTQQFGDIYMFTPPGYLQNASKSSDSYGLQIGAAKFGYGGSLIFGGYDKGRGLGPITQWSGSTPLQLQDVTLGVETGGSPWNYTTMSGLLLNNQSQPSTVPAFPDALSPYLHLPEATCKKLASVLPVYYDSTSMYYLWNTTDPMYSKVLNSAAWLGFVFPGVSSGQVTIKVPMVYLNMTLMPAASGLANAVQYFPCQSYTPNYGSISTGGSDAGTYVLGRAFLQAAFLGRNWGQGIYWLAQAPGPGANKAGLGYTPTEIADTDTSVTFNSDLSQFNQTMTGYWTPIPTTGASTSPGTGSGSSDSGLSTGAKAGIGIGIALAVILLIALGIFLFRRHKKRKYIAPTAAGYSDHKSPTAPGYTALQPQGVQHDYYGYPAQHDQGYTADAKYGYAVQQDQVHSANPKYGAAEMSSQTPIRELAGPEPHELDGRGSVNR